jgi:ABC-2 type transport system ATP-binding protein
MKQRVSLARAVIHDPPVLILDEPAAGLDPRARVELRELLKTLADQGKAILISSHILTELAEICTGAAIIEQGRLLGAGNLDELAGGVGAKRLIEIHTAESAELLHREMLQMPAVEDIRLIARGVEVQVPADHDITDAILPTLLSKGFRVRHFSEKRMDLEDVFMSVTKGEVQ